MSFDPFMPLTDLVATIKKRDVSPVELLQACLQRIERFNPELNAFVALHADRAMEDARRLEKRLVAGEELGPLAGVPFGVKDLEDVKEMARPWHLRPEASR
jgi:Asp-tRNA(Asn)/Glu-tRNA(Gln) amidotransferase A subunit family amidase